MSATTWTVITRIKLIRKRELCGIASNYRREMGEVRGEGVRPSRNLGVAVLVWWVMALLLLTLGALLSLPLTAVGLPGSWMFLLGVMLWKGFVPAAGVGWFAIGIAFALAALAEALEWGLASKYTDKYGGSRRAGWGAIVGGLVGAVVGVPIPLVGSVIGSFVGAFLGALVAEWSVHQGSERAGRVAWGALVGRVVAAGLKVALGIVIAVVILFSAIA